MMTLERNLLDVITINGKAASEVIQYMAELRCRNAGRLEYLPMVVNRLSDYVEKQSDLWDDVEGNHVPGATWTLSRIADAILSSAIVNGEVPTEASQKLTAETLISGERAVDVVSSIARKTADGNKDLADEIAQDIWADYLPDNRSLWDVDQIRATHEKAGRNPNDPTRNYSAKTHIKREAERLKREKELQASKSLVLPVEKDEVKQTLKGWNSVGLPEEYEQALASDRMHDPWRKALEGRYLEGKSATEVGRQAVSDGIKRLSEILPSVQNNSDRRIFSEVSLDALLEKVDPETDSLPFALPSVSVDRRFAHTYKGMSYERFKRNLLGSQIPAVDLDEVSDRRVKKALRAVEKEELGRLDRYDLDPELYYWANGGEPSERLEKGFTELDETEKTLIKIRYSNALDSRAKRNVHEQSIAALNRLRSILSVREGKGMLDHA
ncbi:hypothetical protein [Micromonospora globbae]|uniref:hypothetical protein n=1 Tax=Micromonospora globbae TaxID=1894969 RepID=UPI0011C3CADC|nr:hypothetical protein [Micromonospora globbae]